MSQVMATVRMMLANHAPFPALAVDRAWNILLSNSAFDRMSALLGEAVWQRVGGPQRNLMRLFFHPEGIRPLITNWSAVAPLLWRRAQREAEAVGGHDMKQVLSALAPLQDAETLLGAPEAPLLPVMPFTLERGGARLSMFGVISTFGTAQDATADELRIETLFPADAETEALFRAMA
jgi:hypothetical protein